LEPLELPSRLSPLPPVILTEHGATRELPMRLWAAQWIVHLRDRRARAAHTVDSYRQGLEQWLHFANQAELQDAHRVTVHYVDDYLAWLTRRRLKPVTVNHRRTILKEFFRYMQREGAVGANPVELTDPQKAPRGLPRGLSLSEQLHAVKALSRTMQRPDERRDMALIATLFLAGLRCQEAASCRCDDLDLVTGTLLIRGKGDRERQVPLDKRLLGVLREYLTTTRSQLIERDIGSIFRKEGRYYVKVPGRRPFRLNDRAEAQRRLAALQVELRPSDAGYLFVNASPTNSHRLTRAGETLTTRAIYNIVRKRVSPIVGRPVSPHVLRHSLAQRLLDGSGDLQLVQAVLGHVDLRTTQIYARMSTRAQREAFAKAMRATDDQRSSDH